MYFSYCTLPAIPALPLDGRYAGYNIPLVTVVEQKSRETPQKAMCLIDHPEDIYDNMAIM